MRVTGTVKFFNTAKGFGFIELDEGGKDVFVHATALEAAGIRMLTEGDRVLSLKTTGEVAESRPDSSRKLRTAVDFWGRLPLRSLGCRRREASVRSVAWWSRASLA